MQLDPVRGRRRRPLTRRLGAVVAAAVLGLTTATVTGVVTAPAAHASTVGGSISRTEILARAQWWMDTYGVVYSQNQSDAKPDGDGHAYRPDCSGFVSMAWHLPKKSDGWDRNTRDLADFGDTTYLSSLAYLQPGDAILGESYGHVALFDEWADSAHTQMWIYDEYSYGEPGRHTVKYRSWYEDNGFRGLRYNRASGGSSAGYAAPAMGYDQGDGSMRIYRWSSSGASFTHISDYDSGSFSMSNVDDRMASGDVDGDGRTDVVMAYQNSDGTFGFHVFRGGITWAGIWYTSGQFSLDAVGGRLVVADFTGDGRAEPALVRDNGDGTMRIYRWTSDGNSFNRTTDYDSGAFHLSSVGDRVAAGDVDGDGRADIVMAYQLGDGTFAYYVFKSGASSLGQWYTSGTFNLGAVAGRLVLGRW